MPLLETKGAGSAQGFGLSLGSAEPVYIEQTFSTYLYTGNGSTQTITNGIDLSTKGGLVWSKDRSGTNSHRLYDTVRGGNKSLSTNQTAAQDTWSAPYIMTFNSNGYETGLLNNENSFNYASWTFRKQPKFFDIVTYTGTGATQTVAHNLGSAPGMVIVKVTSTTNDWFVWHRGLSAGNYIKLNTTDAQSTTNAQFFFGNGTTTVDPSSTVITLGGSGAVNGNGVSYVAYLFAHDAGGFGLAGTDNVISCGSYTGAGSPYTGGSEVTLGYEPQWVLIKSADNATDWVMIDNMRGWEAGTSGLQNWLYANTSGAENTGGQLAYITSTGFKPYGSSLTNNTGTYIYIAIRRGPMKVPTVGTSVYDAEAFTGTGATRAITTLSAPDMAWIRDYKNFTNSNTIQVYDRLRGNGVRLRTGLTNGDNTNAAFLQFNNQMLATVGNDSETNGSGALNVAWAFKRAPGFFDEVCYTGTGANPTNFSHNLGAVPELMIFKKRSNTDRWECYSAALGSTKRIDLNTDGAATTVSIWGGTPTATQFSLTDNANVNQTGQTYVAYLFATCAGVSKVGSYTGTGTTLQINCGFTGGARFVLIKRTDSTGDWYVWDSARGIIAGNDPYLLLNSTAAEVTSTDYVDTYSAGFEISSTAPAAINASAGSFIFLAIA